MFLNFEQVAQYHRDGFILVENVFSKSEVEQMLEAVETGGRVAETTFTSDDGQGKAAKLAIWFDLTDDIWSKASASPRIVNNIRILMGEEISFFHGKVMLKEAKTGGSWEWHQDYGYWYDQGFVYPHLISAFTALDPARRENGCLRVLKGSHKMGRVNHRIIGNQTAVDTDRVQQLESMFELVECTMSPGSVLFFHCNLLHSSGPNNSDYHRRSFIMCYNAWGNPQLVNGKIITRAPCPVHC